MIRQSAARLGVMLVCISSSVSAQVCTFGDGDGDADVDFADFQKLQRCLGGGVAAGCAAFDFDGDSDVDLNDLAQYGNAVTGPMAHFDYGVSPRPDAEAEQLALEFGSSLLATDSDYNRIHRDMAAIRAFQPDVAGVHYIGVWVPNDMIVKVLDGVPRCDFDELNAHYGMTNLQLLFHSGNGTWYVVHYPARLKITRLAIDYAALPEVEFAEPNGLIGIDDYVTIQMTPGAWVYDIDDGFLDCFDGCDCHVRWRFSVDAAGHVTQQNMTCQGQSWCEFPDFCFSR